jgi:hypothetical protein
MAIENNHYQGSRDQADTWKDVSLTAMQFPEKKSLLFSRDEYLLLLFLGPFLCLWYQFYSLSDLTLVLLGLEILGRSGFWFTAFWSQMILILINSLNWLQIMSLWDNSFYYLAIFFMSSVFLLLKLVQMILEIKLKSFTLCYSIWPLTKYSSSTHFILSLIHFWNN